MRTIETSRDVKTALTEIKEHILNNSDTVKGEKRTMVLMNISNEVYLIRSASLQYNSKIEFAMMCDQNSMTHLFQVQ